MTTLDELATMMLEPIIKLDDLEALSRGRAETIAEEEGHFGPRNLDRSLHVRNADAIAELRKKNAGLVGALRNIEVLWQRDDEDSIDRFERVAELFYRDTRIMAPGKSVALAMADSQPSDEARREAYDKWVGEKIAQARQALKENAQ